MECLTAKETIDNAFEMVSETSYSEKKLKIPTEDEINNFLDKVLEIQKYLNGKSEKIEEINNRLDGLTWLNDVNEGELKQINTLIGSCKDLHSVLVRQFVGLNFLKKRAVAKAAVKRFKESIDVLKESIADLESIFFNLPQMPEFKQTTKELSLV
jgi:peptidoglycan hydrolase CwlO-like protein